MAYFKVLSQCSNAKTVGKNKHPQSPYHVARLRFEVATSWTQMYNIFYRPMRSLPFSYLISISHSFTAYSNLLLTKLISTVYTVLHSHLLMFPCNKLCASKSSRRCRRYTSEEINRPSNIHHPVHNSPPLGPILSHIYPIHTFTSYFIKIQFNIVILLFYLWILTIRKLPGLQLESIRFWLFFPRN
jgi:hypothetical protein